MRTLNGCGARRAMADLLALERLCRVLPDRINDAANKVAVQATQAMADDLIDHTPVDTTEHASNWQVSVNQRPSFGLPAIVPGERGSTAPQSRREAKAHVARALKDKAPGVMVDLANLAPAIEDLNRGTSKQEPAGMVERGIRKAERFCATHKLEIKL